jgi:MFS family permease
MFLVVIIWLAGFVTGYPLGGLIHSSYGRRWSSWASNSSKNTNHHERTWERNMKPIMLAGIGLILLGILGLSYNRINYTSREKILDIGPIEATAEREKSIPLPPLLGGLVLVAGIGLVAVGYKK